MKHRVALASSDGKMVNEHFGHARRFIIVDISDDGSYEVSEIRNCINACGGDDEEDSMGYVINMLSDCEAVITCRTGISAKMRLNKKGINTYEDPGFIEDVLKRYIVNIFAEA